jgi:hypothetical protein
MTQWYSSNALFSSSLLARYSPSICLSPLVIFKAFP